MEASCILSLPYKGKQLVLPSWVFRSSGSFCLHLLSVSLCFESNRFYAGNIKEAQGPMPKFKQILQAEVLAVCVEHQGVFDLQFGGITSAVGCKTIFKQFHFMADYENDWESTNCSLCRTCCFYFVLKLCFFFSFVMFHYLTWHCQVCVYQWFLNYPRSYVLKITQDGWNLPSRIRYLWL